MYKERMNGYYPLVVQAIKEFQAIINSEYPEIEALHEGNERVLADAYLTTMTEERIEQWEKILKIQPIENSTIEDRRDTILARVRGQGKLNTALINSIVNTFTGGTAISYIIDSILYVEITPPPENKQYQFANVEQELALKVPAHLDFKVARNYYTWNDIKSYSPTWQNVYNSFLTWEDVYLYVPFDRPTSIYNRLGSTTFHEFILGGMRDGS